MTLRAVIRSSGEKWQFNAIAWSCDGRRLVAAGRGGVQVWEFDGDDQPRRAFGFAVRGRVLQVIASPVDPDVLIYATGDSIVMARLEPDGRFEQVWERPHYEEIGYRQSLSFSPDGAEIVFALGEERLHTLEVATGLPKAFMPLSFTPTYLSWSPSGERILVATRALTGIVNLAAHRSTLLGGSQDGVRWIAWSPDGTLFSTCDDDRIRVHEAGGALRMTLEGHTDGLLGLDFSRDGRLMFSVSIDGTIRCWDTTTWRCVSVVPLGDSHYLLGGIAASPGRPLLARRTQDRTRVEIYEIDADQLVATVVEPARTYANAKVVLVGDTSVGKSGLSLVLTGRPYEPTDSTHAREVRTLDEQSVELPDGGIERREILLWDLAGQPGYRLIHQLHLAETALALLVFDARSEIDPFAGVRYWARALKQHTGRAEVPTFLVAARADRGGIPATRQRIDALCAELGLAGYFETSAKDGRQIRELAEAIRAAVDWSTLPRSVSNVLFETIKQFLLGERAGDRVLATADDLYRLFLAQHRDLTAGAELRAGFDTCVRLLDLRDLVRRLSFGGFVLLRPELLDAYASSLIDAARAQPDGLGFLAEADVLAGRFPVPAGHRLTGDGERLLLITMVEELLRHDLALREPTDGGIDLVFPSQLTADGPDEPGPGAADVVFRFDGALQTVYATLAVRLAHVSAYRREGLWRNAGTYRAAVGGLCGLRIRQVEEGRGELTVFFADGASEETRFLFEEYVHEHLKARAQPGSVIRDRVFTCSRCGYLVPAELVRRRQARGDREMRCPDCEEARISLLDRADRLGSAAIVRDMNASADAGRDRAAATATIRGKEETGDYDVFLSYNAKDREAVRAIADRLRADGLLPWFDTDALRGGDTWQEELKRQIGTARGGAVLLGPHGIGTWQALEQRALIDEHARRDGFRLIPVLLPGAPPGIELPGFLGQWHAVDFRVTSPDPFERLRWAITGERPPDPYAD